MKTKICIAGATGKMGSNLSKAIAESDDMEIVSALARNYTGQNLGDVLNIKTINAEIYDDIVFALRRKPDILVDFTNADIVKRNVLCAIEEKIPVVIGSSGLTDDDFKEIEFEAKKNNVGVIAAGNFSISAVMMIQFAEIAAKHFPVWEIIEYSYDGKKDAPSGTARELASRLSKIKQPKYKIETENVIGLKESRGANVSGTQIHSVRLPGYNNACGITFGTGAERLTIHHESIDPAKPYIDGVLIALRKVQELKGLYRGLDKVIAI
ncbi:MAG: 4-hydroxy-tetrahydrodipicolinate reductase [Chitinophagales bacterium]